MATRTPKDVAAKVAAKAPAKCDNCPADATLVTDGGGKYTEQHFCDACTPANYPQQ